MNLSISTFVPDGMRDELREDGRDSLAPARRARRISLIYVVVLIFAVPFSLGAATLPAGFTETLVAGNLTSATAMAIAPDGRIFVCLQGGSLRVVKNGVLLPTPFLTVNVNASGERGLLGVAFDPNFAANRFIYVYYTTATSPIHNRVSRFIADGDTALAGSETILLELDNLSGATNHNGGAMHFGPDGKLYVAVGENAAPSHAQTLGNLLGKMLRLNPDGSIPEDNPFFNATAGKNRAIWALGLRNPYTFAFQPGTGRMFINDVGQNTWEEINDGIAGSNYGWPTCEGSCPDARFRNPLFQYAHSGAAPTGCAITGGTFYNPGTQQFPGEYTGRYFFADFCTGFIRLIDPFNASTSTGFATGLSLPVDLRVAGDGSLYYLQRGNGGQLVRIQYPAGQTPPSISTHPQSQTVAAGQSVSFSVSATGNAPLAYQWQRNEVNIPNANSNTYTQVSVGSTDDGARFRCIVTNAFGSATSNSATLTLTPNTAPTATINSPPAGTFYHAGDTINYSGAGTDGEDGALPPNAFTWQVDFHHDTHAHPFIPATSGITGGSFRIPTTGETAANVFYRIYLTVTDSGGLTHTVSRDVTPRTATITLATSPAGLQVTLDGQPRPDGYSELNVVGIERTLGVVSPQIIGGETYNFVSWSNNGAATHNINVPAGNATYTALFAKARSAREMLISEYRLDGPGGWRDEFVELYNNTNEAITVSASDGSNGWALVTGRDAGSGNVLLETYHVIPTGTVIPARGHYLVVGNAYSLQDYGGANRASGDSITPNDLAGNDGAHPFRGVALFRTSDANNFTTENRLDAVGGACADARLSEGSLAGLCFNVGTIDSPSVNYSLVRKLTSGFPQDTDNNADDFALVAVASPLPSAQAGRSLAAELGAPGPENLSSPVQRNTTIKASLIDPQAAPTAFPNRERNGTAVVNGQFGTFTIRRRFTNKTGRIVTALRFRLTGITTLGSPVESNSQADLRVLSSADSEVPTSAGMITVRGIALEQPATQNSGGGLNSTLVLPLTGGALIPNASVDVQFVLGVEREGNFRFFVNVEAVTQFVSGAMQKRALTKAQRR